MEDAQNDFDYMGLPSNKEYLATLTLKRVQYFDRIVKRLKEAGYQPPKGYEAIAEIWLK